MQIIPNKTYIRKYKPVGDVIYATEDVVGSDGHITYGVVRYRNEFGAECVMNTKQFKEFYEEANK